MPAGRTRSPARSAPVTERATLRAALAQMCSADTHEVNIAACRDLAAQAADQGAELLCLPEVAGLMNRNGEVARTQVVAAEDDPFIAACRDLAARHSLWIHTGSTPVLARDGRFLNHSTVIDAEGRVRATYDKVHLFDVQIDGQPPIGESKRFAPGDALTLLDTPWGPWGLTICYDLRFPYVYRRYGQEGAALIFIPSAFTVPTGRAHWEVLIRARAIESGAFILAAAQSGHHADGRETWGHALAVDPWGTILADLARDAPALSVIDLDLSRVVAARRQIPALQTGRDVPLRRL